MYVSWYVCTDICRRDHEHMGIIIAYIVNGKEYQPQPCVIHQTTEEAQGDLEETRKQGGSESVYSLLYL